MGISSGIIGVGVVVESSEFSMNGGSDISTPSVATMKTIVIVGGGKPWYVSIKYGS